MLDPHALPVEQAILSTRPVFYVPLNGYHPAAQSEGRIGTVERVKGKKARCNFAAGATRPATVPSAVAGWTGIGMDTGNRSPSIEWVTDTSYHPGDVFSIGGWVNRVGASESSGCLIYLGGNDIAVRYTTDKLNIFKNSVGVVYQIDTPTFPSPYTSGWQHIIFTKNGSGAGNTCTAYLNGVLNTSTTYTDRTMVAASADIVLGGGTTNGGVTAQMAHWAIWNRVLTAAEAKFIYDLGRNAT